MKTNLSYPWWKLMFLLITPLVHNPLHRCLAVYQVVQGGRRGKGWTQITRRRGIVRSKQWPLLKHQHHKQERLPDPGKRSPQLIRPQPHQIQVPIMKDLSTSDAVLYQRIKLLLILQRRTNRNPNGLKGMMHCSPLPAVSPLKSLVRRDNFNFNFTCPSEYINPILI